MKNINQILRELGKLGYTIESGSIIKIYHPDSNKPFYSCHIGEKALTLYDDSPRKTGILI